MPTTWNRSPEEFHKIYIANTEAFYAALSDLAEYLIFAVARSLWSATEKYRRRRNAAAPVFWFYAGCTFFSRLQQWTIYSEPLKQKQ